jgi:TPR repeat protein
MFLARAICLCARRAAAKKRRLLVSHICLRWRVCVLCCVVCRALSAAAVNAPCTDVCVCVLCAVFVSGKFSDPTKVQRAITLWQLTSDRAFSQINIGAAASIGWGNIKKDEKEANKWFKNCVPALEKEAAKGSAEAQTTLSFCFHNGYGMPKDNKLGLEWYAKAAGQGHAYAQYHFAECFRRGVGTGTPDPKKAAGPLSLSL